MFGLWENKGNWRGYCEIFEGTSVPPHLEPIKPTIEIYSPPWRHNYLDNCFPLGVGLGFDQCLKLHFMNMFALSIRLVCGLICCLVIFHYDCCVYVDEKDRLFHVSRWNQSSITSFRSSLTLKTGFFLFAWVLFLFLFLNFKFWDIHKP